VPRPTIRQTKAWTHRTDRSIGQAQTATLVDAETRRTLRAPDYQHGRWPSV